jgi:hypothetical protein
VSPLSDLTRPFPDSHVRTKPGGFDASYVDPAAINQRLPQVIGPFDWDVPEFIFGPERVILGCAETLSCETTGRRVTVSELGIVGNPKPPNGKNAQIAASQDPKRCAKRLGLGPHLCSGDLYILDKALSDSRTKARFAEAAS